MAYVDFVMVLHRNSKRDYVQRVVEYDKSECAFIAKQWGEDYWDGDRCFGYGGYRYDGRWRIVAENMAKYYGLKNGDRILDVGCGKGYLLYEFTKAVPGIELAGVDISDYAIEHAKDEIKPYLRKANATSLPFEDDAFDFVFSITTLHNLYNFSLFKSLSEINRVCRTGKAHITVESYRNEREKANLLYWQLTCETFFTPVEWEWFFDLAGYKGDYGCIYFE